MRLTEQRRCWPWFSRLKGFTTTYSSPSPIFRAIADETCALRQESSNWFAILQRSLAAPQAMHARLHSGMAATSDRVAQRGSPRFRTCASLSVRITRGLVLVLAPVPGGLAWNARQIAEHPHEGRALMWAFRTVLLRLGIERQKSMFRPRISDDIARHSIKEQQPGFHPVRGRAVPDLDSQTACMRMKRTETGW